MTRSSILLSYLPSTFAAAFGLLLSISLHGGRNIISRIIPRSQWFYLAIVAALVVVALYAFVDRDFRTPFGRLFPFFVLPILIALFLSSYLFVRLERLRQNVSLDYLTVVQDYTVRPSVKAVSQAGQVGFVPMGSLYRLSFRYPQAMYENEDAEVELSQVYISPEIAEALKTLVI